MSQVGHQTARALLRRLAVEQAECRIPSVRAAIVRDGEIAWQAGRGQVDGRPPEPGTQYRIGSITKSVVAVTVMRLRDEGLIDLLEPIGKHLPDTRFGEVTIAQLLSHTGGLTAEPPTGWWERTPGIEMADLLSRVGPGEVKHRPGRRYHYSNLGFSLLGELVARLRGTPWAQVAQAEVLGPLGMTGTTTRPRPPHATGYAVHPYADVLLPEPEHDAGAMAPAGQLWSTTTDLARWAAFVAGDTGGVLSPGTLAEMREPATVADGDAWTSGYGLGLQLTRHAGRRLAGHTGSMPGFLATVWADPADGVGVLFLANTTSGLRPGPAHRPARHPRRARAAPAAGVDARRRRPRPAGADRPVALGARPVPAAAAARRRPVARTGARRRAAPPGSCRRTTAPGSAWTATTPVRRCGWRPTISTSTPSSSPATPTTRPHPCPAASTTGTSHLT